MGKGVAEREINLWDMIWAVCLKWRSIVVCAVVFALLVGGMSYVKSVNEVEAAKKAAKVTPEEKIATLKEGLTKDDLKTAEVYLRYKEAYDEQNYYNENSPLMQLDANSFYKGEIGYYVDNKRKVKYPIMEENNNIVGIIKAYKASIATQDFAEKVSEIAGMKDELSYALELVDCDAAYAGDNAGDDNAESGVFTIFVYAEDAETCKALMSLVEETLESVKTDVAKQFSDHEVKLIQNAVRESFSAELLNYQRSKMELVYNSSNNMYNMYAKLSAAQKAYIEACKEYVDNSKDINENEKTSGVTAENIIVATVSRKLIILAFLTGTIMMFVIWALVYIFSSCIRLEDNFETIFGIKLLGNVQTTVKKKKWFRFIDGLFEKLRHLNQRYFAKEEALEMIVANIRIAAKKANVKTILITGAAFGAEENMIAEEIATKLKADGIQFECASTMIYNAESLEKLVEFKNVVFIEKAEKTLYGEVEREVEICRQQDVQVIGCVVVY